MEAMQEIGRLLPLVSRPSRYMGGEVNSRRPSGKGKVLFALAFPDAYEIGMSYPGLQILYHVLNSLEGVDCERVFCPWVDMEELLRRRSLPLFSLESRRPLREFDIIGFSLQYELTYTNLLRMLELAGIPLLASEREEEMPLVIAGGPCAMQPEPLADFVDLFVLGEAEELLPELIGIFSRWKEEGKRDKGRLLEELSRIEGVYIPSLFFPRYHPDGTLREIVPLRDGYEKVIRRYVRDINSVPYPTRPIVPFMRVVHDRLSVEIARGCGWGCRFCQAGFIYRPLRERGGKEILEIVREALGSTGYDEVSLLALSAGDHRCLFPLVRHLMEELEEERIALSLPSLRVGTFPEGLLEEIKRVRKTGFTLAPEAATERLQRVINKVIPRDELLEAASRLYRAGWRVMKLYFMIGLPTEREEDIREIARLAREVRARGGQVNVSVSTFVPKSHTPFQWEKMLSLEEIEEKQSLLKGVLRGRGIRLKWHDPKMSFLEGVFARGDRRLGRVLLEAHRRGCRFDGWSEHLKWDSWQEAFDRAGVDPSFYISRERSLEEVLPWAHLDPGVKVEYLREERERAYRGLPTPPCREGCERCGMCGERGGLVLADPSDIPPPARRVGVREVVLRKPWVRKIRSRFLKLGEARLLGHLEMIDVFLRAARRASIPMRFSEGFHPLPRITFSNPLPVGVESLAEFVDLELRRYIKASEFVERMNRELPDGLRILSSAEMAFKGRALPNLFTADLFLISFEHLSSPPPLEEVRGALKDFSRRDRFPVKVEKKKGIREVDLVPFVEGLRALPLEEFEPPVPLPAGVPSPSDILETEWVVELKLKKAAGVKPQRFISALLGLSSDEERLLRVLKVESLPPPL